MEPITTSTLKKFLGVLGDRISEPVSLYLLGGSALCLLGSPRETLDVDYSFESSTAELDKLVKTLGDELKLDFEAVPLQEFIPLPPGALQRRRFVGRYGLVEVYIYNLYSISLSKIARGFDSDFDDVLFLLQQGLIELAELERLFLLILPKSASADIIPAEFSAYFAELKRRLAKS